MPNLEKEISLPTRFLVLGLVSSMMIGVLFVAAFSSGPHYASKYNADKKPDLSTVKILASRTAL